MAKRPNSKPKNDEGASPPDSKQRWDDIIDASARIFYEKGYAATSLQDIASAVGLLKGSIYYYIETKEDLLFELVMRAQQVFRETVVEPESLNGAPAADRMRHFIRRFLWLKQTDRERGIVAEREFTRLSQSYLEQVIAGRREFSSFVRSIVQQGVDDGDFDAELDVALASNMVFELMKSSHLTRRPRSKPNLEELADSYALFVMRGLGSAEWKPSPPPASA